MKKPKYTTLMLDKELHDKIQYMAKTQNKSMIALLREIFSELYIESCEFDPCIMVVAGHSGSVTVAFAGKSALISGIAHSDEEVKQTVENVLNERDNHE